MAMWLLLLPPTERVGLVLLDLILKRTILGVSASYPNRLVKRDILTESQMTMLRLPILRVSSLILAMTLWKQQSTVVARRLEYNLGRMDSIDVSIAKF
jgi:hypothetical protein